MRIGVLISFIHNVTDILAGFTRCVTQTRFKSLSAVSFLSCVAIWIYFRNFALPVLTYASAAMVDFPEELHSYYLLQYLLSTFLTVLCGMHLYWTTLFFKMIVGFVDTGSTENQINKIKPEKTHLKAN